MNKRIRKKHDDNYRRLIYGAIAYREPDKWQRCLEETKSMAPTEKKNLWDGAKLCIENDIKAYKKFCNKHKIQLQ